MSRDRTRTWIPSRLATVVLGGAILCSTGCQEVLFDRKDPRPMVLDEVAGQALALLAAPAAAFTDPAMAALFIALSFGFFRLFDIVKPGLIGAAQNLPSGWGVLMDDLLAGALALGFILIGWNLIA